MNIFIKKSYEYFNVLIYSNQYKLINDLFYFLVFLLVQFENLCLIIKYNYNF